MVNDKLSSTTELLCSKRKESELQSDENFASCLGALRIIKDGWETEAIPELINKNSQKMNLFAKIFGNS